jgi:hypothetical protein
MAGAFRGWFDVPIQTLTPRRFPFRALKWPCYSNQSAHELGLAMKNGLYLVTTKGFDGVDWPPGGVFFLQNGVLLGGSSFMHYIGSYTCEKDVFKGECVAYPHTPPPVRHLYFNAKEVGVGLVGSYEGDQAELTASVFFRQKKPYASSDLEEIGII